MVNLESLHWFTFKNVEPFHRGWPRCVFTVARFFSSVSSRHSLAVHKITKITLKKARTFTSNTHADVLTNCIISEPFPFKTRRDNICAEHFFDILGARWMVSHGIYEPLKHGVWCRCSGILGVCVVLAVKYLVRRDLSFLWYDGLRIPKIFTKRKNNFLTLSF